MATPLKAPRKFEEEEEDLQQQLAMGVTSASDLNRLRKEKRKGKSGGFESLGLCYEVYRGVKRKGYRVPTPIQRRAMPIILSGADVVAVSRTGSGKTAAFVVPMLQKLRKHVPQAGVRALILSPTRDLAIQTLKFTQELGRFTDLKTSLLVGGDSMANQFEELTQSPDIIIATPGRLMHHLSEIDDISLRTVEYAVFDEADCLFSMGFAEQLNKIVTRLGENRQTLLFSATFSSDVAKFSEERLRDPREKIMLDMETKISPDLELAFFTLRHEEKLAALLYLVRERIGSSDQQQTLIFVSTKHHVEFLNVLFRKEGIEPSISYGDMDQNARKKHISRFRARKTMLLIVTDVAARGLDIPLLDNVINWDFPREPKLFVHRVGRVARAGRTGTAYSFFTSEDMPYLLYLHLFLSKPLKPAPITGEEALKDANNVNTEIDVAIANGETVYGRFPQPMLDLVMDRVKEMINGSAELQALENVCAKAFKLYKKNKSTPCSESIRRSKDLPREGLHPFFRDLIGSDELSALAFSERLKSFKPKQTILEAEGDSARVKSSRHLEAGLSVKGNDGNRLDAAVLDLAADDSSGIYKQKAQYHWDKKRKKYIKLNNGERVTASGKVKTDSGAKLKATKTGIYEKWKKSSHLKISLSGKDADGTDVIPRTGFSIRGGNQKANNRFMKSGRAHLSVPNAKLKSELKDPEQVRKMRQQKATKIDRFNQKHSKGKKFQKKGNGTGKGKRK